jgi:hypothetical protein
MLKNEEWKPKNKGYEFLKIIDWEADNSKKSSKEGKMRSNVPDDVPESKFILTSFLRGKRLMNKIKV